MSLSSSPMTSKTRSPSVSLDVGELLEQALEDGPLDSVRRDEIEDIVFGLLADPVDAPHALLKPVGVPGQVVVDHQVAELEIDAFARGLGRDADLLLRWNSICLAARSGAIPPWICVRVTPLPSFFRRWSSVSRCSVKINSFPRPSFSSAKTSARHCPNTSAVRRACSPLRRRLPRRPAPRADRAPSSSVRIVSSVSATTTPSTAVFSLSSVASSGSCSESTSAISRYSASLRGSLVRWKGLDLADTLLDPGRAFDERGADRPQARREPALEHGACQGDRVSALAARLPKELLDVFGDRFIQLELRWAQLELLTQHFARDEQSRALLVAQILLLTAQEVGTVLLRYLLGRKLADGELVGVQQACRKHWKRDGSPE